MNDEFLGTIALFPYDAIPYTHMKCDGSLIPINRNTALFNLIRNAFGGDGTTNFRLPNLAYNVPIGIGPRGSVNVPFGTNAGTETNTLAEKNLVPHIHPVNGRAFIGGANYNDEGSDSPQDSFLNTKPGVNAYANATDSVMGGHATFNVSFNATGNNNVSINNMQPTIAMVYAICVNGRTPQPTP